MNFPSRATWARVALFALIPTLVMVQAGPGAIGPISLDLTGHVWTVWNTQFGSVTSSQMVAWPDGVDLMPILGGWLDIFLGSIFVRFMSPILAFNLACAVFLCVGGWGGYALARAATASPAAAMLAGILLQLDGFLWHHMLGGRSEQLGAGFVALALAAAWKLEKPGWGVLWTGIAGALVVFVSWEHAMFLSGALVVLLPAVRWTRERMKAWAMAAGVCLVAAGPWAVMFMVRTLEVRQLAEGVGMMDVAPNHSIVTGWWLMYGDLRPSLLCLVCLGFLRGRAWAVAGVGLLFSFLLAVGPTPGWMQPGDLGVPGLWAALQSLPVFGWFHTPDRLLVGLDLAAVCGAAVAFDTVGRRFGRLKWALGLALVVSAMAHIVRSVHPKGHWLQPEPIELPGEGAVLDVPAFPPGLQVGPYQFSQMLHQRPIPYHMTAPYLTHDAIGGLLEGLPQLQAFVDAGGRPVEEDALKDELIELHARGVGTIILHQGAYRGSAGAKRHKALTRAVGKPDHWNNRPTWDLSGLED